MKRTFVVGDIHGCFDELMQLVEKFDMKEDDLLLSLGDIVDRGPKSKEVYHYFRSRPNSKVLMGNHERKHLRGILSYSQEIVKVQFGDEYDSFLQWTSTLEYYHECNDAFIVHAAVEPGIPLVQQKPEVLAGSTSGERHLEDTYGETHWIDLYNLEKPVIYGHHVVGDVPLVKNTTYGIDTACCHGGFLTAIELPGFIIHQVKCQHDYWKDERVKWQVPVLRSRDWLSTEFSQIDLQINKLMKTDNAETLEYLNSLRSWSQELQALIPKLYDSMKILTERLIGEHGTAFSQHAKDFSFGRYLFQLKGGKFTVEDLSNSCKSPLAVLELASALQITGIPPKP
jgi:serine/threonine protein phosphatase 1